MKARDYKGNGKTEKSLNATVSKTIKWEETGSFQNEEAKRMSRLFLIGTDSQLIHAAVKRAEKAKFSRKLVSSPIRRRGQPRPFLSSPKYPPRKVRVDEKRKKLYLGGGKTTQSCSQKRYFPNQIHTLDHNSSSDLNYNNLNQPYPYHDPFEGKPFVSPFGKTSPHTWKEEVEDEGFILPDEGLSTLSHISHFSSSAHQLPPCSHFTSNLTSHSSIATQTLNSSINHHSSRLRKEGQELVDSFIYFIDTFFYYMSIFVDSMNSTSSFTKEGCLFDERNREMRERSNVHPRERRGVQFDYQRQRAQDMGFSLAPANPHRYSSKSSQFLLPNSSTNRYCGRLTAMIKGDFEEGRKGLDRSKVEEVRDHLKID